MYKLIAFDYDGTLVDTLSFHTEFIFSVLNKYKPDISKEEVKTLVGKSINEIFENKLPKYEAEKHIKEFNQMFKNIPDKFWGYVNVIPNAKETLLKLKLLGIKTAIVSNSHYELIKESVKRNGFSDVIDLVVGADIKTPMGKEERLKETLKYFNIDKEQALYVGDTSTDILNAKNVNIHNCLVYNDTSWFHRENISIDDVNPEFIIDDISKLLNIL